MTHFQLVEKFHKSFVVHPVTLCWIWQCNLSDQGYGRLYIDQATPRKLAHRFAYELYKGPIPDSLTLDHLCRVRSCVNPSHLEAVTTKVNVLRGQGPTAQNARQKVCPRGHLYSKENTLVTTKRGRSCRECNNIKKVIQRITAVW